MSDPKLDGGEHGGGEADEEKTPINNVDVHAIHVRNPPPAPCCVLSKLHTLLLVLVVCALLVLVAVLPWLLMRPCPANTSPDSLDNSSRLPTTPRPTVDPSLPWSDIRLPRSLLPLHYSLQLTVDLDTFTFTGITEITVRVAQQTRYVIVHVNALSVRRHSTHVRDHVSNATVALSRQLHVRRNQFYVLVTSTPLQAGRLYTIRFGHFSGQIQDDLRGLYRSMYRDSNGKVK